MVSLKYFFLVVLTLFFLGLISFSHMGQIFENNTLNQLPLDYNVYALPMPSKIDFAGELLPLNKPDIKERMDRELLVNTYWQSNGFLMFKRAHKYFPIIEPILKSYGVPDDFKYLAVIESGLQNTISKAGAKGFWQIMKSTGKEYGMEINSNVDERYNLNLSTKVACKYFLKAKEKFGSWTLSAAAYNAGINGIASKLERQSVSNYYDLLLGQETSRYLFRIIASKHIMTHPKEHGFNFSQKDLYNFPDVYEVEVDTAVTDFVLFAKEFDINYKQLKIHNPWLRDTFLNNKSRKKYKIQIPKSGFYNP